MSRSAVPVPYRDPAPAREPAPTWDTASPRTAASSRTSAVPRDPARAEVLAEHEQAWLAYFDETTEALGEVRRQLEEREPVHMPELTPPDSAFPACAEQRRLEVAAQLAAVIAEVRDRRDEVGSALAAMSTRRLSRPRPAARLRTAATSLGGGFDLAG